MPPGAVADGQVFYEPTDKESPRMKYENKKVLSRYPTIPGYPHLFVLDTGGRLLHSQDTSQLESGRSYDLEKFFSFLKKWAPVRQAASLSKSQHRDK
jgi:hypothetical protein